MRDSGWLAVWPVAAFFLGGLATQLTAYINHRRQRTERAEDDAAALQLRREEFELAHLVEVNSLLRAARAALGEYASALSAYKRTLDSGSPDRELGRTFTESCIAFETAESALASQVGFIIDDEVRRLTGTAGDELKRNYEVHLFADDPDSIRFEFGTSLTDAYAAIAARVRDIYAGRAEVM
ncbi:hypothetical protein [Streptomyces sp. NPDC055709]